MTLSACLRLSQSHVGVDQIIQAGADDLPEFGVNSCVDEFPRGMSSDIDHHFHSAQLLGQILVGMEVLAFERRMKLAYASFTELMGASGTNDYFRLTSLSSYAHSRDLGVISSSSRLSPR